MAGSPSSKQVTLSVAWAILVTLATWPLGTMLVQSLFSDGAFGLGNYVEALGRPRVWTLLLTASCSRVSQLCRWHRRRDSSDWRGEIRSPAPNRDRLDILLSIVLPPYVLANGWFQSPRPAGVDERMVRRSGGAVTSACR